MCVKDSVTGEFIGDVSTSHPKVISGEWVHHTKGTVSVIIKETNISTRIDMQEYRNNPHKYKVNVNIKITKYPKKGKI